MTSRRISVLGVLLAAVVFAACGAASAEGRPAVPVDARVADVDTVVSANTELALDVFRFSRQGSSTVNPLIGAHSIATAMTIGLGGARGTTADELARALGHTVEGRELHETVAALDESLQARHGGKTELSLANRVWLQTDLEVVEAFDDLVGDIYDAGPVRVDFRTEFEAAIADVNDWGDAQTNGLVPKILGEVGASKRLRWIVVNATYFNGEWAHPFDEDDTRFERFTLANGSVVSAETMVGDFDVAVRHGERWRSARLPYFDGGLSMVIVVPDDLDAFVATLDGDTWRTVAHGLAGDGAVGIEMPKFSARWRGNLVPVFEELGVVDAFGCDADFSGIFRFEPGGEGDTNIGFVQHEAFIDVSEAGTEAAAVTAVGGFQKVSAPLPDAEPIVFKVDRPFLYAVTDDLTGAILFLGEVTDPRTEPVTAPPGAIEPRLCG